MRERNMTSPLQDRAKAYPTLRDMCLDYAFWPCQQLQVDELAALLRLSATPVREALARLAGEGLIDAVPNRGYFAKAITPRAIECKLEFMFVLLVNAVMCAHSPNDWLCERPRQPKHCIESNDQIEAMLRAVASMSQNTLISDQVSLLLEKTRHVRCLAIKYTDAKVSVISALTDLSLFLEDGRKDDAVAALRRLHDCLRKHLPAAVREAQHRSMSTEPLLPLPTQLPRVAMHLRSATHQGAASPSVA